jgi:hypothetical protein
MVNCDYLVKSTIINNIVYNEVINGRTRMNNEAINLKLFA